MSSSIGVAIVEDNDMIRESLAAILNGSPGFRCLCACRSAEDAVRKWKFVAGDGSETVSVDVNFAMAGQ